MIRSIFEEEQSLHCSKDGGWIGRAVNSYLEYRSQDHDGDGFDGFLDQL